MLETRFHCVQYPKKSHLWSLPASTAHCGMQCPLVTITLGTWQSAPTRLCLSFKKKQKNNSMSPCINCIVLVMASGSPKAPSSLEGRMVFFKMAVCSMDEGAWPTECERKSKMDQYVPSALRVMLFLHCTKWMLCLTGSRFVSILKCDDQTFSFLQSVSKVWIRIGCHVCHIKETSASIVSDPDSW